MKFWAYDFRGRGQLNSSDFIDLCTSIIHDFGFEGETFLSLVEKWKELVAECSDGYMWEYSECVNEMRARHLIEQLSADLRLRSFSELPVLLGEVKKVDYAYKKLLQTGVSINNSEYWWERGVLVYAGQMYCDYMRETHGISVEFIGDR